MENMEPVILNSNFEVTDIVDYYISFIWTDRYSKCGDFELYLPATTENIDKFHIDYYMKLKGTNTVMIIETIETVSNSEDGDKLKVTGRSLESILDRRVIWGRKFYNGKMQDAVENMLTEAFINPSDPDRKVDNFVFQKADASSGIADIDIHAQYFGDNIYDVITHLCEQSHIGFSITLDESNKFIFQLYKGVNRTYSQSVNHYVIFSPKYENLVSTNYIVSYKDLKNVSFVGGEGDGAQKKTTSYGSGTGLNRRELYTDASSLSQSYTDENGAEQKLSDDDYINQLKNKGKSAVLTTSNTVSFEGELAPNITQSILGKDYFLGDLVQIVNENNREGETRITEVVHSQSSSQIEIYPTFSTDQKVTPDAYTELSYSYGDVSGKIVVYSTVEQPHITWGSVGEEYKEFYVPFRALYRYGTPAVLSDDGKTVKTPGKFTYRVLTEGKYTASNNLFGRDPDVGANKKVWIAQIGGSSAYAV